MGINLAEELGRPTEKQSGEPTYAEPVKEEVTSATEEVEEVDDSIEEPAPADQPAYDAPIEEPAPGTTESEEPEPPRQMATPEQSAKNLIGAVDVMATFGLSALSKRKYTKRAGGKVELEKGRNLAESNVEVATESTEGSKQLDLIWKRFKAEVNALPLNTEEKENLIQSFTSICEQNDWKIGPEVWAITATIAAYGQRLTMVISD